MSETTGTSSFLQELEEWYTWLDNALVLDALMRVANEEAEQSSTGTWLAALHPQQLMNVSAFLRVCDVLLLLSSCPDSLIFTWRTHISAFRSDSCSVLM